MTKGWKIAAAIAVCGLAGVASAAGTKDTVHAKDFGWNAKNATAALQKAIDSGAAVVEVDNMGSPWYVGKISLRSDLTIRLAKGVRIHTYMPEWEQNRKRSIFLVEKGITNFTLEGAGMEASLVGSFETKKQRLSYCHQGQEFQTGVYIGSGATNVVIRNLALAHCGCDGLSVGGWRIPSHNVLVENVDMWDNHRQACSPMVADGLTFRRCKFRDTEGTEPTAGVDMEPCYDVHPIRNVLFEDCEFGNNNGGGFITPMSSIFPIDVTLRRCTFHPEKGRSPIDILARGDTYMARSTPADVKLLFEDCTIESYGNDPAINFATGPIFSCVFRNVTIKEVPGFAIWRPARKCAPVEFRLDRDYHGAFPPEKSGKVVFENVTATGYKGRPFIQFVDTLGKQDVIGYFSGTVTYNGEKVDTSKFTHKAMDVDAPVLRRIPVNCFEQPVKHKGALNPSNVRLVPWGDWYEHAPCYAYYFHAQKGDKIRFSVVYPQGTDTVNFKKKLEGVHLDLETPEGKSDLGELHAGTNRFSFVAKATGWHSFFPPFQDGEGNYVHVEDVVGTRLAWQGDTVESGEMKFTLRDAKKDYVGYFVVPPNVDCRLRVSRGTVELRDPSGSVVGRAIENEYAGRKILTFRAKGNAPEVWSFRTPPGGGKRVMRFYAPLNGIWADDPALLPRVKDGVVLKNAPKTGLKELGYLKHDLMQPLGDEFKLKAEVLLQNVKPDVRCDAKKTRTYTVKVRCYKRRGQSVRLYNYTDGRPDERDGFDQMSLYLPEKLEHPVWADAASGQVCEIPSKNAFWTGTTHILKGIPIRDTPVVVCDRGALPLVGDKEEAWSPPVPQDIVLYEGEPLKWTGESVTVKGAWDLTQNRTIRVEIENRCKNGGARVCVLDQGSGRSSAWVPAGFKGTLDIDLLAPLEHPELRQKISGMQSDPFYRCTFSWTPEPQLFTVRDLMFDHVGSGKSSAPGEAYPELVIRKVTALDTSKKQWPKWFSMDEKQFFPFIDRYGQFVHKDWPNKTYSDSDLQARAKREAADLAAHPGPKGRDRFGGWTKGPKQRATGRFRLAKVNGKWWFVDPDGNLWWSHGIVRVTPSSAITPLDGRRRYFAELPKSGESFGAFYKTFDELLKPYYDKRGIRETFDFSAANLCRKYGADWRKTFADLCHRRLRSWGLNTIANGSDREIRRMNRTPYVERLETHGPKCKEQKNEGLWWHVPDPYSDEFRTDLRKQLEANREELTSPWCLGLFVDNEHNWTGISEKTMREYFRVIREEIKRLDPNLLYFGCRFSNANPTVVKVCAEFADAVSYNRYACRLDGFKLPAGVDKPILVGEFHFGSLSDTGLFKPSLIWTPDQKHRAEAYRQYVEDALDHPNFVGVHWHQFSDQATTGRFDGENANVGFTDVCDTPYAELVEAARALGETMYDRRSKSGK